MLSKDNLIFLILFQIWKKKKEVNQMNTVIKGTKSITEFKRKKSELTSMAEKNYADHVEISETWTHGEPVKTWYGEYPWSIFIE